MDKIVFLKLVPLYLILHTLLTHGGVHCSLVLTEVLVQLINRERERELYIYIED